jgi:hypothetical protein
LQDQSDNQSRALFSWLVFLLLTLSSPH